MWGLNDFNFAELEEDCIVNGVSVPMRGLNDFNIMKITNYGKALN
jgi:hypothetical protein